MTTLEEVNTLADAATAAINNAGLKLEPSHGMPDLDGGLTSTVWTDGGATATQVTMAILTEVGIEAFDVAKEALDSAEFDLSAGTPNAIGSVAELDIIRHGEVSHHTITHGGHPIGLVIVEAERRGGAEPEASDPAESPTQAAESYAPQNFSVPPSAPLSGEGNLTMLSDVMLNVTVELGRQSLTLSQVLNLAVGSVVELDRAAGAPVDVRVNGILFGRGEVVVVDNEYAVRIIEILETPGS